MKYLLMGTSSNFGNMFSMAVASLFLPFLPMLPTQILLNNFLYDLAQVTIPTDNVDPSFIRKPQRWDIGLIREFMLFIGPISSIYDFLTFYVMLVLFKAGAELFHTGWFVESLATQTLVLFVIRTAGNPFRSRPSVPLTITTHCRCDCCDRASFNDRSHQYWALCGCPDCISLFLASRRDLPVLCGSGETPSPSGGKVCSCCPYAALVF